MSTLAAAFDERTFQGADDEFMVLEALKQYLGLI